MARPRRVVTRAEPAKLKAYSTEASSHLSSTIGMKYPPAPRKPTSVRFGSVSYTDNYQWLEDDTPESLEWQTKQDNLAKAWLSSRPSHAKSLELQRQIPRLSTEWPTYVTGRWFLHRRPEDQDLEVIQVSDSEKGPWRTIVDFNEMAEGEPLALDNFAPSPDGKKLLFGWGAGGRELQNLRVIDVDSGQILHEAVRQIRPLFPTWLPDSSGFYYSAYLPQNPVQARVFRQILGTGHVTEPEEFELSHPLVWVQRACDNKHSFICADHLNPRPDFIRDESTGGAWQPFLNRETAQFRGDVIGDHYYAVTDDDAPCGKLVAIPLATPKDRSTWKVLLPGSKNVLATLIVVDEHLVLIDLVDTWSRMRIFAPDGRLEGEVPLPARGSISAGMLAMYTLMPMAWKGEGGDVMFPFSSPLQSPGLYKVNVHSLKVEVVIASAIRIEGIIQSCTTTSADGATVPYHVIARAGTDLSKQRPTLIYGYGGFALALIPGWTYNYLTAWLLAGGVIIGAHLRGGGELGPQMFHSGRLKNKQNTFNDVYAIAEDLIKRNITTAAQLGVVGESNGGVMAATVAVQRPDLFRAAVAQVPITDILARKRDPITITASLDYGDPDDPEMSEVIYGWSPYQNVKDGTNYPAILLDSGSNDPRCPPWHARKLTARLQQADAGNNPILMRIRENTGHGAAGHDAQVQFGVDYVTFFADQLGLSL